ncbi:MAG: hypothetical protein II851_02455 [Bacteroidales bacterium]|nr:hypothetical protein [Bacteroidales bacterium]
MKLKINRLPYPLCRIGASIRRRRFDRWMRRWARYASYSNLTPIHD